MERMIEVCCGSYEDALASYKGGAKRIELNSALYLGGLTPTLASLILVKKHTDLKVITMVRPRGAGFCYTEAEFESDLLTHELAFKDWRYFHEGKPLPTFDLQFMSTLQACLKGIAIAKNNGAI